jgi:hypothetical protein
MAGERVQQLVEQLAVLWDDPMAAQKAVLKAALLAAELVDWMASMKAEMKGTLKAGWLGLLRVEQKGL